MDSTRVTVSILPRTDIEGWGDAAVNYPEEFSPAIAQLTDCFRNVRIRSLSAGEDQLFPGGFTPVLLRWSLPWDRMAPGPTYIPDTHVDPAWIAATLAFDPAQCNWSIDSQRVPNARYRTDTNRDSAWVVATLSFDPALYAPVAQIHGTRTAESLVLAVQLQVALYDLSWVHDVIPLTDPDAETIIHLRPIAPIMSARRRNKKRR